MTSTAEQGGLTILAELERAGAIDATSLRIQDPDFSYEKWALLGYYLGEIKSRTSWYLGDWLLFAESGIYGERWAQALDATGLTKETLENYASTCRRVPRSRRRESLSFGHHTEVAKLEPRDQSSWLDEAEKHGWKRAELRARLDEAGLRSRPPAPLPAQSPLAPKPIVEAARSLVVVRETLDASERGEDISARLPAALAEVARATETLVAAAAIPDLKELAVRVVDEASPHEGGYFVPLKPIDELRLLVKEGVIE